MVQGIVIPARIGEPVTQREFQRLEDYHSAVSGYIEPVELASVGATLFANEEGLIRQFEFNSRATFLWWYHEPAARKLSQLVGDVVIVGRSNRSGAQTDLPSDLTATLVRTGTFSIEAQEREGAEWFEVGETYRDYFDAIFRAMVLEERSHPARVKVVNRSTGSASPEA